MKKVYKKLGAIGATTIPAASIISCGEVDFNNREESNEVVNSDEVVVDGVIQYFLNEPLKVNSEGEKILPSKITTPEQLKTVVNEEYFYKPDNFTQIIPVIKSPNNIRGELTVDLFVHRGLVTKNTLLTFTNFLTINKKLYQDNVANAITNIENAPGEINNYGHSIFPETAKSLVELEKSINGLPSGSSKYNPTIVPKVIETDNEAGSLVVEFTVTQESIIDTVTITYYGFLTVDQNDINIVSENEKRITNEPKITSPSALEILPNTIGTKEELKKYITVPTTNKGAVITIESYTADELRGSVTVSYTLTKGKAQRSFDITYNGFKKIVVISSNKVPTLPNVYGGWVQPINERHYLIGTYTNGVYQVEMNPETGAVLKAEPVSMAKTDPVSIPSVAFGWSQQISERFYLIGTAQDGVYQVEVNPQTGAVIKTRQVSLGVIPNVETGFAIQIAKTTNFEHYLIGTYEKMVYQVKVNPADGSVVDAVGLTDKIIPSVKNGWAEKINDNKYLIGTLGSDIYQVTVTSTPNTDQVIVSTKQFQESWSAGVSQGWIQHLDNTHYLVGTNQRGVYQVEVNQETGLIMPATAQPVPTEGLNSIPKVNTGWIQKVSSTHYLVGTYDQGVYWVEVNPENGQVIKTTPIAQSGQLSIPSVAGGFIQQVGKTNNFLIGTLKDGLYQVKINDL